MKLFMKKPYPLIITSIFPHSPAIKEYLQKDYTIILVGDLKTPHIKSTDNLVYLSVPDQKKLYKKFSNMLPYNHYARKNIGYLVAMSTYDAIIETDDDNFPHPFFDTFKKGKIKTTSYTSKNHLLNTYKFFSKKSPAHIWPRGFPLSQITNHTLPTPVKKVSDYFPLQQSLVDSDGDFDAIYRLTNNTQIPFRKNKSLTLQPHTYAPLNTQNTYWGREVFLLMYIPSFVSSRVCDIYRGYIAQRLIWEMNKTVLFLSPSVYQKRNEHDFIKDFVQEVPLYTEIEKFLAVLEATTLSGSLENKMIQLYEALVNEKLLERKEITLLKEWISLVHGAKNNIS